MDFRTIHLGLDWRDQLWLLDVDGDPKTLIGHIDSDPQWPASEGPEPRWFLTEVNELVDRWEDARRYSLGCREAVEAAYGESRGV